MTKIIELRMKPLDYYFFGTNETFDSGSKGIKNYSIKSNPLPQQTGLLGLLRHLFYNADYDIGESFDHTKEVQDFGDILTVSPLYLVNEKEEVLVPYLYPLWKSKDADVPLQLQQKQQLSIYNSLKKSSTFYSKAYDPKMHRLEKWVNLSTGDKVPASGMFKPETHIGIDKGKTMDQRTEDGAFYRQQFYRLKDVSFAFQAEVNLKDDTDISRLSCLLPFGGEKKPFVITVRDSGFQEWSLLREKSVNLYSEVMPAGSVLLLTDTYVTDAVAFENCVEFGVLQAKPFRNIRTPAGRYTFSGLGNNTGDIHQLYKPEQTTFLLKQGSLIFGNAETQNDLAGLLKGAGFSKIGYNQFIVKS